MDMVGGIVIVVIAAAVGVMVAQGGEEPNSYRG
jgi:hypothetical protein